MRTCWLGLLLFGAACNGPVPPTTFPVQGTVLRQGQPVTGGTVQFTHTSDPTLSAVSAIDGAGRYSLSTLFGTTKIAGAVPGAYSVVVLLPGQPPPVFTLPEPRIVQAESNELTIELGNAR